jgi:hypothetical protein
MLPDIRAVFAAFVAVIGRLMIAFAAVATFRVAQGSRVASLQFDLARRGQAAPPQTGQRVAAIETPGPHIAPPPPLRVVEIKSAPVGAEAWAIPLVPEMEPETEAAPIAIAAPREEAIVPVAEAPVGGPLAEPAACTERSRSRRRQKSAPSAPHASAQDRGGAARRAGARERETGRGVVVQQRIWKFRIRKHARKAIDCGELLAVGQPARETRRSSVDEFRTNLVTQPPHHAAIAAAAGQHQDKLLRHIDLGMQPHAAVGHVGDPAIARQRAGRRLYLGEPAHREALAAPPVLGRHFRFGLQHDA